MPGLAAMPLWTPSAPFLRISFLLALCETLFAAGVMDVSAQGSLVRKQGHTRFATLAASGAANVDPRFSQAPTTLESEEKVMDAEVKNWAAEDALEQSACNRRRRDPCSYKFGCELSRCQPGMFVGGPMKLQQMSNGCGKYMGAKNLCISQDGKPLDLVEVRESSDLQAPPIVAQWNIVDIDGHGTRFRIMNIGRQAANCSDVYLAARASAFGGDLQLEPAQNATEFEVQIHKQTNYYSVRVAGNLVDVDHAFLNNPADCADGALPTLGRAPDLWRLVPADTIGSREADSSFSIFGDSEQKFHE